MPEDAATTRLPDARDAELMTLRGANAALRARVLEAVALVPELETRLAKDSHDSSKSPSSDPPFKKPPRRTPRQPRGKKPGGQKDHPGATLSLVAGPERTVTMPLSRMLRGGQSPSALPVEDLPERRQVANLVVWREVTEYWTVRALCTFGQVHRTTWPTGVHAPAQYGAGVAALALYLTHYWELPYQRTAGLVPALAGIALAPARVHAMGREAAVGLSAPVTAVLRPAPAARAVELPIPYPRTRIR